MAGERTSEGWELRLRTRDGGRFISAAFLAAWLCFWAVGEAFALWFLVVGAIALVTGKPPEPGREPLDVGPAVMTGVFLLFWLAIWTIGGIAAIAELFRLMWGEDRMLVSSGRLHVEWRRGPFRSSRRFDRDVIRRVSLQGRGGHIALQTTREGIALSALGSRSERSEGAAALRTELGLPEPSSTLAPALPAAWEQIITPEGERALVSNLATRRAQARTASMFTLFLAAVTLVLARQSFGRLDLMVPAFIMLTFTIACTVGTLWLARGRWEWRIGADRLTLRKRYGDEVRDVFEARRLVLEQSTDSDGDSWYELRALAAGERPDVSGVRIRHSGMGQRTRTVARVMDDLHSMRELAAWLARETELPLDDLTTAEARQVQLAQLRDLLANSGRFGRWAAKVVDHLEKGRPKQD